MVSNDELVAVEAATDERHDESVEFLRGMIRTPIVNPPGEYAAIHDLVTSTYEGTGGRSRPNGFRRSASRRWGWIRTIRDRTSSGT